MYVEPCDLLGATAEIWKSVFVGVRVFEADDDAGVRHTALTVFPVQPGCL